MESPHMYDSDYSKKGASGVKVKSGSHLYDEYTDLAELSAPEISLDLHGLIDDSQFSNEGLIQDIQGLSVDKNGPRGLGANPAMYGSHLSYLPQPVHGASQFERSYDRHGNVVKEEPSEGNHHDVREYSSCARLGMASYPNAYHTNGYASMTPTTIHGANDLHKSSPLKSPANLMKMGSGKKSDKGTDEYKRRRERNNIAVRKSREKAKLRSRETEERVKKLMNDNDRLQKKCELLGKEVATFHSMFANVNVQYLPEQVQREVRKQIDSFSNQHQHLLNM